MATPMELDDLRKLTVVKLRAKLSELGLTTSGLKADLVERLHKWYQENADPSEQDEDEGMPEEPEPEYHERSAGLKSPPRGGLRSPERSTRSMRSRDVPDSHPPPMRSRDVPDSHPPPMRSRDVPDSHPPPLMSIPMQEPPQRPQPPPSAPPPAQTVPTPGQAVTRTALQLRLQQMAGQPLDKPSSSNNPPSQPPPPAPQMPPQRPPPPKMGQGPPPRMPPPPGQMNQPPPLRPPAPGMAPQQPLPPGTQPMGPPRGMGGPPPPGGQPMPPQQQPQSLPPHPLNQPPPPQQRPGPPPPQMGQPVGPPPAQINQPPPLMQPHPQRNQQDQDLQEKVAMQTRLLEQERQQQEQQQRILEQQQKERLAIQQQAMLLQQQQAPPSQPGPPSQPQPPGAGGPGGQGGDEGNTDLMERVRQQQMMLEQQKQKERLEQQQKALIDQQNQAIKKQEEERRRNEAELIRQQRIALREAQREEQQNKMRDERRGPPPPPREMNAPPPSSGPPPFNPQPNLLSGPRGGMMPPPNSGGMPPMMPPHSAHGGMPPPPFIKEDMNRGRVPPPPEDRGPQEPKEMKLPSALEKVLAFKDVRAQEVGLTQEELEQLDRPNKRDDDEIETIEMEEEDPVEEDDEQDEATQDTLSAKESKNKKRKKKKKKRAKKTRQAAPTTPVKPAEKEDSNVVIEYVPEQLELDPTDPNYFTFSKIFEAFKITEDVPKEAPKVAETPAQKTTEPAKPDNIDMLDDDDDMDEKVEDDTPKLSKKKMKKAMRMSVAQLKQKVTRPDLVEMHDVTAPDPLLLVHLKSTRNTVPVPRHWCFKRKYLQGKRGIEKPPFELPDYIQATGITEMRAALAEKEEQKNLKAKMREKVRPKLGKIDIDYQKLHDAFFRFQTKPKMTIHGDLYYEGKEFETRLKEKKPGNLSDDLKTALGMPIGPTSEKVPPPWLIAMQRYGPPPSYPSLKIPGLNAPIPEGCSFGYHAGGWGKPPVDENGKPLYGDVFGTKNAEFENQVQEEEIDKSRWGELESESESEEESEEEEEEEMPDETGLVTPAEGLVTPSGITSIPVGMETPDMIELRKKRIEDAMDQGGETPALYQVLPEKKTAVGGAMMGSAHIYDVTGVPAGAKKPGDKVSTEGIEVALNPEELDLDSAAMQAKYDQTLREQQSQLQKEDLSDMVAEHAAKQKKRKKKQEDSGKAAKKYKEFKF